MIITWTLIITLFYADGSFKGYMIEGIEEGSWCKAMKTYVQKQSDGIVRVTGDCVEIKMAKS